MLGIITLVFLLSSWYWSNRQQVSETFYAEQLQKRDAAIEQLHMLALPQVQGKTSAQVEKLFQNLYPQHEVRDDNGVLFAGELGVCFSDEKVATGFFAPGDAAEASKL